MFSDQPDPRAAFPPDVVAWWYMVARTADLRPGAILRFDLGEHPLVLFRGRDDGIVRALPAHCEHQGVDLVRGKVCGNLLRCPLHHWEYSDRCERIPGSLHVPRQRARYTAVERRGMIFVHPGDAPPLPVPSFHSIDESRLHFLPGTPVDVDCPWYAAVANAFDMTHLETVHRRALVTEPETTFTNELTFVVRYATAITGGAWSDAAMRALSGNRIEVIITSAGGTMLIVEARAGRWRSYLLVSLRPTKRGVSILPLYAVERRRDGMHALQVRAARLLFNAFLRRDVQPLSGIRFPAHYVDPRDPTINDCYRHLCALPPFRNED